MKTVRILAAMFVAVLSLGFVACSDDDDDDDKKDAQLNFEELVFSNYGTVKAKMGVEPIFEDDESGMFSFGDENKYVSTAYFMFEGDNQAISVMSLTLKPEVKEESVLSYLDKKYHKIDLGDLTMYSDTEDWLESKLLISYTKDDVTGINLMYMNQTVDAAAKSRKSVEEINAFVKEHTYKFF